MQSKNGSSETLGTILIEKNQNTNYLPLMNSVIYLFEVHDKNIFPHITDPPTIQTIPDKTIRVGGKLSITCQVSTSNPLPQRYTWTKVNDDTFKHTGSVLVVPKIQLNNAGTYRCTAINAMVTASGRSQQGSDTEDVVVDVVDVVGGQCVYTTLLFY